MDILILGGTRFVGRHIVEARLPDHTWTDADLSPLEPGVQAGRYFVELRIADAAGAVREVWY